MKRIIILASALVILLTVTIGIVFMYSRHLHDLSNFPSEETVILGKEIGDTYSKSIVDMNETITKDTDAIVYTGSDYDSISTDVYSHVLEYISTEEWDCMCTLIQEWANKLGCLPDDVKFVNDNSDTISADLIVTVKYKDTQAEIHILYDWDVECLKGYLKEI